MKKFIQFYLSTYAGDSQAFMKDFKVYGDYVESLDSEEILKNKNKYDNEKKGGMREERMCL
jgi:hypothetical protein